MLKQTIFLSSAVSLSLKDRQMVVSWKDNGDKATRPIEDIGFVVIENQQVSMTIPLINELVRNNVAVIICDHKQMPTSMLMGLDTNSTQAESLKHQLQATEPMKKQAWKQVIEAKIRNQAGMLTAKGKNGTTLKTHYLNVKSGDTDNREGISAKIYWKTLLGDTFK